VHDVVRLLATWALIHETADEGWRAAVTRGESLAPGEARGPDAFVDGLAALVAEEKERLKRGLAGARAAGGGPADVAATVDALCFEVAELRGRIETLQASIDALVARATD
jgi:hypothetical protein